MLTPFSPTQHLARLTFLGVDLRRRCYMTAFSSWSDTSGAQADKHVLVTVAVVSDVKKLTRFDREWSAELTKEGVSSLHMTDLEYDREEFAAWKDNADRKSAFLARMANIGKRGLRKVIMTGVDLAAYRAANEKYALQEELGGPYSAGQLNCYLRVVEWLARTKPGDHPFEFFVEQGDNGQDDFIAFMKKHDLPVVAYPKKSPTGTRWRPFEFADYFAYEHRKLYSANMTGNIWTHRWRESLLELRRTVPFHAGILEADAFDRWYATGHIRLLTAEDRARRAEAHGRKKRR